VALLVLLLFLCSVLAARGQQPAQSPSPWGSIVREFASKIVTAGSVRGEGRLSLQNLCSLDASTADSIEGGLLEQLSSRGFRDNPVVADNGGPLSPPAPPIDIRVTLSQNLAGLIWIAELRTPSGRKVVMLPVTTPTGAPSNEVRPVPAIVHTVSWRQPEPMLDFAMVPATPQSSAQLMVLSPERVTFFRFEQDAWHLTASAAIEHPQPWPRDLRGRIELESGKLSVYLPGIFCSGSAGTELGLYCAPGAEKPWPVGNDGLGARTAKFDPARNYFVDPIQLSKSDGARSAAFYSAAELQDFSYAGRQSIRAALDGSVQLAEGRDVISVKFPGWGSDIVSFYGGCAGLSPVLATGTGDDTSTDTIQIYQVADRQAVAAGQPISFPGPVRALWLARDANSARVVSQNLQTGMYEASSISISCDR
jgi:hypothetical protein